MSRIDANIQQVAVNLIQHQLDLAASLLQNAKESREAVLREDEVFKAALEAYRNSMEALAKLPQLSSDDRSRVDRSAELVRAALRELGEVDPAP